MVGTKDRFEFAVAFAVSLVVGLFAIWKIFDLDLFLCLVAGRDLLNFQSINVDSWSHTLQGQSWTPLHWLAYIFFAAVERVGGYEALSLVRPVLVFFWSLTIVAIVRQTQQPGRVRLFSLVFLIPFFFIMCQWRIFLRAEFLTLVMFGALIYVWLRDFPLRRKLIFTFPLLVLWGNTHIGTLTFGGLFVGTALVFESSLSLKSRALFVLGVAATFFLTPSVFAIFELFDMFFNYSKIAPIPNPDFMPFIQAISMSMHGWSFYLLAGYTVFAFATLGWAWKTKSFSEFKGPYKSPYFSFLLALVLTFMTYDKVRGLIFQTLFLLPIASFGIGHLARTRISRSALAAFAFFFLGWILPAHIRAIPNSLWGVGLHEGGIPLRAMAFFSENKVVPEVLNSVDTGSTLRFAVPDLKVFVDGRHTPFFGVLREWLQARRDLGQHERFLKKYKINSVVEEVDLGVLKMNTKLLPVSEWAVVSIDNLAIVYLRRIPEHQALIEKYEYKVLRRDLRPIELISANSQDLTPLKNETLRCIDELPSNAYCNALFGYLLLSEGNKPEAVKYFEKVLAIQPTNSGVLEALKMVGN